MSLGNLYWLGSEALTRCQSSQAAHVDIERFTTWELPDREQSVSVRTTLYSDLGAFPPDPQGLCHHFLREVSTNHFEKKAAEVALHGSLEKLVGVCRGMENQLMYCVRASLA
jgi:hypothetical protein